MHHSHVYTQPQNSFFETTHKLRVAQKLQESDCVVKVMFCIWFYETVCNGEVSALLTGLTDKAT